MNQFILTTLFAALFALAAAHTAQAQSSEWQTGRFAVTGNCGQCKARIEQAALGRGVRTATWDANTQVLTFQYRPDKTTPAQVRQRVAAAGHDADGEEASTAAYERLPACCRYREGHHVH